MSKEKENAMIKCMQNYKLKIHTENNNIEF